MTKRVLCTEQDHALVRKITDLDCEVKAALLTLVKSLSSAHEGDRSGCEPSADLRDRDF